MKILAIYFFIDTSNAFWKIGILTILFGLGYGAPFTLTRALMADIIDADELRSGEKRPGLFFAIFMKL